MWVGRGTRNYVANVGWFYMQAHAGHIIGFAHAEKVQ